MSYVSLLYNYRIHRETNTALANTCSHSEHISHCSITSVSLW